MRKVFVVDDCAGGAGNIAQLLALEYFKRKDDVSVIFLNLHNKPRYDLTGINCVDCNLNLIKGNKAIRLYRMIQRIKEEILKLSPQIVISFLKENNILVGLALKNIDIPLIVSERSNPLEIEANFPFNILEPFAYKRAGHISVQFECFKEFANGRFKDKCVTTPNPVMKPVKTKEYFNDGNKDKTTKLIALGSLYKIKGYDKMLHLISELKKRGKRVTLDIYGEGNEKDAISRLIDELGLKDTVFLRGKTNDVYKVLAESDIYLMTSLQEGFPNALCEAMATGLVCMAYRCHAGFDELIQDNINGFLFEKNEQEKFVNTIIRLIENPEEMKMTGSNAKRITETYSMKNVMDIWDSCIASAIKQ